MDNLNKGMVVAKIKVAGFVRRVKKIVSKKINSSGSSLNAAKTSIEESYELDKDINIKYQPYILAAHGWIMDSESDQSFSNLYINTDEVLATQKLLESAGFIYHCRCRYNPPSSETRILPISPILGPLSAPNIKQHIESSYKKYLASKQNTRPSAKIQPHSPQLFEKCTGRSYNFADRTCGKNLKFENSISSRFDAAGNRYFCESCGGRGLVIITPPSSSPTLELHSGNVNRNFPPSNKHCLIVKNTVLQKTLKAHSPSIKSTASDDSLKKKYLPYWTSQVQ
ncbi:hypothetical protein AYI68_g7327 [Smittium mucronatum]|uniref:Uncharacterized protein n=1 Tax=Smittium mucronatum TaxID=133383 RepID=A0A1R0GP14_9FUNG|nr:hypothetical protein AYI68_g7327 [Smittium mucronatum]